MNVKVHIPEGDRIIVIETLRRIVEAVPPFADQAEGFAGFLEKVFADLSQGIEIDPAMLSKTIGAGMAMGSMGASLLQKEFEHD